MKLHDQIPGIANRTDLVAFVRALESDLRENSAGWENVTLGAYLTALASWLEDSDGYYRNQGRPVPTSPSWRDVADMLMAAKMYE
jgi:hypothetical protein